MFIDADPITGNARCEQLEAAYQQGKTKAVMARLAIPLILLPCRCASNLASRSLRCPGLQLFDAPPASCEPWLKTPWAR